VKRTSKLKIDFGCHLKIKHTANNIKRRVESLNKRIRNDIYGQTLTEYAILMGLVAIVSLIIVSAFLKAGYGIAFSKYANLLARPYIYR
jgi:Flp pilus assembly pilin Flp